MYQAPWINRIRGTIPGKLVLGNAFHWSDLLAYATGIAFGAIWEGWRILHPRQVHQKRSPIS